MNPDLRELLVEVLQYLEDHSDAEYEGADIKPNKAMRLAQRLSQEIDKADAAAGG